MIKKFFIGIIVLIGMFSLFNIQKQAFIESKDGLELVKESFFATGAKYEYSNINAWSKTNDNFVTFDRLNDYVEKAIKSMWIDKKYIKTSRIENDNFRQIDVEYEDKNSRQVSIVAQTIKNGLKSETYVLIDEYLLNGYDDVLKERKLINGLYQSLKLKPRVTTCFVGTFGGMLNKDKNSSIVNLVLNKLNAKKVEGMEDENILSVSAHSDKIKEYIEIGSEKINLNVATRYSSFDNKTYIWVATPIIAIEY